MIQCQDRFGLGFYFLRLSIWPGSSTKFRGLLQTLPELCPAPLRLSTERDRCTGCPRRLHASARAVPSPRTPVPPDRACPDQTKSAPSSPGPVPVAAPSRGGARSLTVAAGPAQGRGAHQTPAAPAHLHLLWPACGGWSCGLRGSRRCQWFRRWA